MLLYIVMFACLPFVIVTDMIFCYCSLFIGMLIDIKALQAILAKRKRGVAVEG